MACVLILLGVPSCKRAARANRLAVAFTCDTRGRLEPCGCFEGQMGGLTRIYSLLGENREGAELRVDVGDIIEGSADYNLIEYRYLLRAYADMGFAALNLGHRETALSADVLAALSATSPVPLISANVRDKRTDRLLLAPYRIIPHAAGAIAVIGVVDPRRKEGAFGKDIAVEDMAMALNRELPEAKRQARIIVLLAFTNEERMQALAKEFYELDLILGGDVAQPSQDLRRENKSLILYVTNQARSLGSLTLQVDASGIVEPVDYAVQLVHDRIPEAPRVLDLASAYKKEVAETPLAIDDPERADPTRIPGVRLRAEYVGSAPCFPCHEQATEVWRRSRHARSFSALRRREADRDPSCIGCHTVGFGTPSGYRREFDGQQLGHVGCESCHGPGSLHLAAQTEASAVDFKYRPLGAGDCKKCHHGEFSRPFIWSASWPPIRHGDDTETEQI